MMFYILLFSIVSGGYEILRVFGSAKKLVRNLVIRESRCIIICKVIGERSPRKVVGE